MNKVILSGRLTKDVDLRTGNTTFARFSMAVNRNFKNQDGKYDADFPGCVAFGKNAENIAKYFHKGSAIIIIGRIQTGSYKNKDGQTVYTTDVVVDEFEFGEKKTGNNSGSAKEQASKEQADDFMNVPSGIDEELPFA